MVQEYSRSLERGQALTLPAELSANNLFSVIKVMLGSLVISIPIQGKTCPRGGKTYPWKC